MHRTVLVTHISFIEGSNTTKNMASVKKMGFNVLIFLVICEWARHKMWMRQEWTLRDNYLTSCPTKNSSKLHSQLGTTWGKILSQMAVIYNSFPTSPYLWMNLLEEFLVGHELKFFSHEVNAHLIHNSRTSKNSPSVCLWWDLWRGFYPLEKAP
jgi:hypothetical protein